MPFLRYKYVLNKRILFSEYKVVNINVKIQSSSEEKNKITIQERERERRQCGGRLCVSVSFVHATSLHLQTLLSPSSCIPRPLDDGMLLRTYNLTACRDHGTGSGGRLRLFGDLLVHGQRLVPSGVQ